MRSALFLSCTIAASLLAPESLAQPKVKGAPATEQIQERIGLGVNTGNAPLGMRMWMGEFGFDAGLGFILNGEEPAVDDPDQTTITADFALDGGLLMALYTGENSIAYGRLGLNFDRRYAPGTDDGGGAIDSSQMTLSLGPEAGIELFMGWLGFPELSLQGSVGLAFSYVLTPENGGERGSDWAFGSVNRGLNFLGTAQVGFHYYFDI